MESENEEEEQEVVVHGVTGGRPEKQTFAKKWKGATSARETIYDRTSDSEIVETN